MDKNTAAATIEIAAAHVTEGPMASSAALCLSDARKLFAKGDWGYANSRALASLGYSVGCFHADFSRASKLLMA